ncbi:MAG: FAD-dependent oxidoreductase [Solirubrobacterales bacterium]
MKSRVLIAGGGVAALEAALALREVAADQVEVELFSPRRDFVYRPYAVGEPYGAAHVARYDLDRLAELCGARFHLDSIASVNPASRLAITHDGESFAYDYLVVAAGVQLLWPVPGAITFWGIADEADVEKVMSGVRSGELGHVVFTMPSTDSWALPLYELALLARARLDQDGREDVRLSVVTPEEAPLQIFGRQVGQQMGELLSERRIEVRAATRPVRFADGRLEVVPGEPVVADAAVSLPRLRGRQIRGVPHDENGFIPVDDHGRVLECERLFAAGDITSFPVKQGGIAAQQADAAATAIAADAGADVEARPLDPLLRGVLWTGTEPRYLEGWIGGGHGEGSSLSAAPPADPAWHDGTGKIVSRYLTPFLAGRGAAARREMPGVPL